MKRQTSYSLQEAQQVLEHFCAYQERTHQEVQHKLRAMGMIPEAQERIILHLLQHNFLNEERYAKAFSGGKFRIKKWGKVKIEQALRQKGVSAANRQLALQEIEDDAYHKALEEVAIKWLKSKRLVPEPTTTLKAHILEIPYTTRQKLIRYLQQKGYELALIYRYINGS